MIPLIVVWTIKDIVGVSLVVALLLLFLTAIVADWVLKIRNKWRKKYEKDD
jgi:Flp pilus assembly protein TadB